MSEKNPKHSTSSPNVGLIVGASGEIGTAVAKKLADQGLKLYVTARTNMAKVNALGEKLSAVTPCELDLRNSEQIEHLCETIYEKEGRLDVLVNCAAINIENPAPAMTDKDWNEVIEINLTGAFRLCRSVAKYMMVGRYGKIVTVSSVAASTGGRGQINYAAAKAGLESMTRVLALELGRKNITVNSVAPGCIETRMTSRVRHEYGEKILENIALRRFGTPEEIAELIRFLVSDACTYMTGQVIRIDGGYML